MSWARDGSDLVTWFTGREQLSELWRNHMHAIKCIATCKPSLAQLNLDSPQHALSNGYRVWGVKVTLGYEGKRRPDGQECYVESRLAGAKRRRTGKGEETGMPTGRPPGE